MSFRADLCNDMCSKEGNGLSTDHTHVDHKLYCSVCTFDALIDTLATFEDMLPEISNRYRNESREDHEDSEYCLAVLTGAVDSAIEYLMKNLSTDGARTHEAYLGICRCTIERLSIIYYLLDKKKGKVRVLYSNQLRKNGKEVLKLLEPHNPQDIAEEWLKERWDDHSQRDLINKLPNVLWRQIYGYVSRTLHTINLDGSLAYWETQFLLKCYLLIYIVNMYNDIFQMLPETLAPDIQKSKHSLLNELTIGFWRDRNVKPDYLLAFTSFGLEKGYISGINLETYNQIMDDIKEIYQSKK